MKWALPVKLFEFTTNLSGEVEPVQSCRKRIACNAVKQEPAWLECYAVDLYTVVVKLVIILQRQCHDMNVVTEIRE